MTRRAAARAAALAAAFCAGVAAPATAARILGVVVGIDDYAYISDLQGAGNDARDLARALRGRGAEVTLLLDRQATRDAVVGALRDALGRAQPGDVVVFTFAGHGIQQDEALPGDEVDGKDESFAMAGFDDEGALAAERIRDNDVAALLAEAPEGVAVVVVADSCHSGTMTRAPRPGARLGRTRFFEMEPLGDDPLPPPDPSTYGADQKPDPQVLFASAARDDQLTPEITIDGEQRGALSWSIARAIEGAASGGDAATTLNDVRAFVRSTVRNRSDARQDPDVAFAESLARAGEHPAADAVFRLFNPDASAAPPAPPGDAPVPAAPPVVHALAPGQGPQDAPQSADLAWDARGGALYDVAAGDRIGAPRDAAAVEDMALKWRAARGLALWVPDRPAELRLAEGDGRHVMGDDLHIVFQAPEGAPRARRLTLVNLAATGEVQYVSPSPEHAAQDFDLLPPYPQALRSPAIPVIPPPGADTLVAIYTETPPTALRAALRALHGRVAPLALLETLAREAGDPRTARIGLQTVYTAVRP